jgi:hypothetical protein
LLINTVMDVQREQDLLAKEQPFKVVWI